MKAAARLPRSLLIVLPIATFGLGYWVAPRESLNEVSSGFFQVDTTKVLSATVESLRAENTLVVWSYKGTATVKVSRSKWWLFKGEQRLIVPYAIDYRLNLADLTLDKVEFNEKAKIVTVHLPKLRISDVAFQPEQATTINGGLLTFNDDTVQALNKLSYKAARKAAVKQSQQKTMLNLARKQAKENVQSYFEIPLRIAGQPDVRVVATFD
jgi:hypothetical protein